MVTRAWLGRGRSSLTGGRLVLLSAAASAVVTSLLVTTTSPYLAVALVVALGAALAAIFPAVLGVAGSRYPDHSGTVFGILFTMALSGGMTLPWVTGQAAAAWGLRRALGLVVLQFLAVLALQWFVTARPGGFTAGRGASG
jgi:fucose permease